MGVSRSRESNVNLNANVGVKLLRINDDVFYDIRLFLQRSDLLALKLTCKAFYQQSSLQSLLTPKAIFEEICQYRKTIAEFDEYAWKNSNHMLIKSYDLSPIPCELHPYLLCTTHIETFHLWWFHLVATYHNTFPGRYYLIFHSSIRKYSIELKLTISSSTEDVSAEFAQQEVIEWTIDHNPSSSLFNEEIIEVPRRGDLRISLKETNSLKHREKIFYMLLVPEPYWAHLSKVIKAINVKPQNVF